MEQNYTKDNILTIYRGVLNGKRKKFPKGFWNGEEGKNRSGIIIRYLIEEKLKWTDDEVKENFSARMLYKYRLGGMLADLYNYSPYLVLENAYPGKFKIWEFHRKGIWQSKEKKKIARKATRWLIDEKLKWKDDDIKKNLSFRVLAENKFYGVLSCCDDSPFAVLENAYPGRFKPWELKNCPVNYWKGKRGLNRAIKAIKWILEEKIKKSKEELESWNMLRKVFWENGLKAMLEEFFEGSPHKAIDYVYPGKYNWKIGDEMMIL